MIIVNFKLYSNLNQGVLGCSPAVFIRFRKLVITGTIYGKKLTPSSEKIQDYLFF